MSESLDIVVRFSSLGDIVLCAGFLEKLKSQSEGRIIFATQKSVSDILGTYSSPPRDIWGFSGSSVSIFFKTLNYLNSEHSRKNLKSIRVFDLHGVPKSFFLRMAVLLFSLRHGIRYRSKKTAKKSLFRWLILLTKKDFMPKRHIFAEHQKLLEPPAQIFYPSLRKRIPSEHIDPGLLRILVAPDSQHWKKKWPVSHWEEFFNLAQQGLPQAEFTLVGSSNVFPQDLLDNLKESLGTRFKNRLGNLPLSDLSGIASEHKLTLCGNSAWQHISEAVGVPVISLPGPIVKGFGFSPFLFKSRELEVKLNCRPCTRHGGGLCHRTGDDFHACMKRISPEILLKNTKELLAL